MTEVLNSKKITPTVQKCPLYSQDKEFMPRVELRMLADLVG